jgi:hypothetical protein
MARSKTPIMLDREKAVRAAALISERTVSEVIDIALDRLSQAEKLRRDVGAYVQQPDDQRERALADLPLEFDLEDGDEDYEALYGKQA